MFIRRCLMLALVASCTAPIDTTSHDHSATHAPEEGEQPPGEGEPGPITEEGEAGEEGEGAVEPCGNLGQSCCMEGIQCGAGLVCQDGSCVACGGKGQPCCNAPDMCPGNPVCKDGTCMVCCAVCKGGASSTPLDVDNDPYGCAEAVHGWCQGKCDNPPCVNQDQSGWKTSCQ